ncbi:hypothetical protein [Marinivivus vitaminiproducens]|uniref:hypothetical protein n=1 Tax=Marinivivus vitaminiproducens TaxID=3035935 RepID=UPI00279D481C|nr:hypothetical protein P4R82_11560 [Geminicoccaceae bacterium SCSIO 64248]
MTLILATASCAASADRAWAQDGGIALPDVPSAEAPVVTGAPADEGEPSWRDAFPLQFRVGSVFAANGYRNPEVPLDDPGPDESARLDFRILGHPMLNDRVGLLTNLRLRTQFSEGETYDVGNDTSLDVQELALTARATDWLDVDIGRINVRNGVATGFNPTDWFKVDSLVTADSFDVVDRREDRLGTFVIQSILHNESGVLQTGFRPEIEGHGEDWTSDHDVIGLGLDRTNPRSAFYAKYAPSTGQNLAVSVSTLLEREQPGIGFEASRALSDELVVFAEYFGQWRRDLAGEANARGDLNTDVAQRLGSAGGRSFQSQLALGSTWSLPFWAVGNEDIALTAEYHFNQAGLSSSELDAWFDAGEDGDAGPGELWATRGLAGTRQEPLTQHQLFFRFAWTDVTENVDLGAIAFVSPQDGSALVETTLDAYVFTDGHIRLSGFVAAGPDDSVYGSQAGDVGARLTLSYSF